MTSSAINTDLLRSGLADLGLENGDRVVDALAGYAALLLKWNRVYNLTAIRRPEEVLTHHLLDSAALSPLIDRFAPAAASLLDVGCGGGLPSVPTAVLRPALQVTGIDAVGKKAAFVNQAAIELGLRNLRAVHGRVEKLSGSWDVVTSRAFSSLTDFVTLTRPLVAPGGRWLAMKGVMPEEELAALPAWVRVESVERMTVPGLDEDRHLVVITPVDQRR